MNQSARIRVGTRGSDLALYQANATEELLRRFFPEHEIERVIIQTTGDKRTDVALSEVAKADGGLDKGVFTKELEIALDAGEIDIAVHSLKDVPTVLAERFAIAGVLPRAGVRDCLVTRCAAPWQELPAGARIGTSSVRRAKQLLWLRPDWQMLDLRGNVPTRLQKLADGTGYDAIMLAEAGLDRLGFLHDSEMGLHFHLLEEDIFFPAAGQGAIGLEIRAADAAMRACCEAISHRETMTCVTAEREFLRLLEGGCDTPVGVFCHLRGTVLEMKARVFPEQGGEPRSGEVCGDASTPHQVAASLFEHFV
jgi:hydroxymethylbilane synthase